MNLPKSVLIVDDEPLIRLLLTDLFENAGFSVSDADSAYAAAEYLREHTALDLLVTDVRMAGEYDGLALAHWTREHLPQTKIVIISGYVQAHDESTIQEFDAFLRKPFVPERLIEVARTLAAVP